MGAFKLGKMTFGSLFKKPETVLYPVETKPQPAGLKGHIAIDADACILCGMCERSCSTDCITVSKPERFWEIDRYACVQCGYCITVCPKKCLHMDPNYAPAATTRDPDRIIVPEQAKVAQPEKAVATRAVDAARENPVEKPAVQAATKVTKAAEPEQPATIDEQVETLLGLLDEGKASKVRGALKA